MMPAKIYSIEEPCKKKGELFKININAIEED